MPARTFTPALPVDVGAAIGSLQRGSGDPTTRTSRTEAVRAMRTPDGPATLHLRHVGDDVEAQAWGAGAPWAIEHAPALLGAEDDLGAFDALSRQHPLVHELHRRHPAARITRSGLVLETLVPSILEQRVTGLEARRSFRRMVLRWGEPAPGPFGLVLQPAPEALSEIAYYALHPLGVERSRADTVRRAGAGAARLEALASLPAAEARRRLESVPGVGRWTSAEVAIRAFGDADAVSVGDYHLKHVVCFALTGEPRGSDERMLELLAPFEGHRGRVCRLIETSGVGPPRRAPRQRIEPMARR